MALDPNIILQAQPPQIETSLQALAQVAQAHNLVGAGALQAQQIQGAQLQNQQVRQQISARDALSAAMRAALVPNTGAPSQPVQTAASGSPAMPAPPSGLTDSAGNPLPNVPGPTPAAAAPSSSAGGSSSGTGLPYSFNRDAIAQHLAQSGFGYLVPQTMKSITDMEKSAADVKTAVASAQTAMADHLGSVAAGIRAHNYDPTAALSSISFEVANGLMPQQRGEAIIAQIQQNPTPAFVKSLVDPLIAASPKQRQLDAQMMSSQGAAQRGTAAVSNAETNAGKAALAASQQKFTNAISILTANPPQNALAYQQVLNKFDPKTAARILQAVPVSAYDPQKSPAILQNLGMTPEQQKAAAENATTQAERVRHDKAMEQNEAALREGKGASLTPGALDNAALVYHNTGIVPNLGYGNEGAAARANVINREAEMFPNDNIAFNKATYAANEGSLKGLQKSRDAIVAYENTAGKNLDLFLGLASKMPDSGVPWLNTPLRSLSANVVGSANMAAVKAAINVANNEIAKVTTNPNLTGQLSDAARQEVASYNPLNATFAQTLAISKVLKQDMANREQSYDTAIANVKRRMGQPAGNGGNPQGASSGATNTQMPPGAVSVTDPRGVTHWFPNQGAANNFKKLAGIQ